ncbi:hypothetical protein TYRP_003139 [Tyrophagus putrescentiae]|nr:hypothetical protein TYRP_003139 [Tyrophagus putrescentiae]
MIKIKTCAVVENAEEGVREEEHQTGGQEDDHQAGAGAEGLAVSTLKGARFLKRRISRINCCGSSGGWVHHCHYHGGTILVDTAERVEAVGPWAGARIEGGVVWMMIKIGSAVLSCVDGGGGGGAVRRRCSSSTSSKAAALVSKSIKKIESTTLTFHTFFFFFTFICFICFILFGILLIVEKGETVLYRLAALKTVLGVLVFLLTATTTFFFFSFFVLPFS